jgi:PAS domain S-box-containing protein
VGQANRDDLEQNMPGIADLVENSVVGMQRFTPDGTILWVNQAELDLLGYTREEYPGRPVSDFHVDPTVIEDRLKQLNGGKN